MTIPMPHKILYKSAKHYISLTNASRATATRDLQELMELGVLHKTGELRYARYCLNV